MSERMEAAMAIARELPPLRRGPQRNPAAAPWDYAARWFLAGGCALLAATGLRLAGMGLDLSSLRSDAELAAVFIAMVGLYRLVAIGLPRLAPTVAIVNDLLLSLIQLIGFTVALLPLTYLAVKLDFPLLDAQLATIDKAWFGFDWDAFSLWIGQHQAIDQLLQWAYGTLLWQGAAVLLLGSITRPGERNGEILWLFAISLLITAAIFCFTPALGKLGRIGPGQIIAIEALRDGRMGVFSYAGVEGIISFPSFHTALAIFFPYCLRRHRIALAVILPLNALMLVSVPVVGGHYLIDMVGGALVALIAILVVRRMRQENVRPVAGVASQVLTPAA